MAKSQSSNKNSTSKGIGKSSFITKGTSITGNFTSSENVRVDGSITGDVDCKQRLVVGVNGKVEGNVKAKEATIQGVIIGDITVEHLISLSNTARLDGKLHAQKMEIEEGAIINGGVTIKRTS